MHVIIDVFQLKFIPILPICIFHKQNSLHVQKKGLCGNRFEAVQNDKII